MATLIGHPLIQNVPIDGWSWYARLSLRARLVAITVLLLAAGLGLASAVTTTVVSNYLISQVDKQLERSAEAFANRPFDRDPSDDGLLPSDYAIVYRFADGTQTQRMTQQALSRYGSPRIPAMSIPEVQERLGEQFTVGSEGTSTRW